MNIFLFLAGPEGLGKKSSEIDLAITDELGVINPSSIGDVKIKKAQDSNAHSLVERVYLSHTSKIAWRA